MNNEEREKDKDEEAMMGEVTRLASQLLLWLSGSPYEVDWRTLLGFPNEEECGTDR